MYLNINDRCPVVLFITRNITFHC